MWAKESVREGVFYLYTNNSVKTLTRKVKNSEICLLYTLQIAKEVFYIQNSQKCQSESNVLQIFRDSIVWKFLPSRVWFNGLNFHTLEKSWKNQVKTSNYWKMCNFQLLWLCFQSFQIQLPISGSDFQILESGFQFLERNAHSHCNTIFAAGIPKFGSFYQVE